MLHNMSTDDKRDMNLSVCAHCGMEGSDVNYATNVK